MNLIIKEYLEEEDNIVLIVKLIINTALFQQDPTSTQEFLTDYGIAGKYFFFYPKDMSDPDIVTFRKNVHDWAKKDCPIFGWVPNDEPTDVIFLQ